MVADGDNLGGKALESLLVKPLLNRLLHQPKNYLSNKNYKIYRLATCLKKQNNHVNQLGTLA